MQLNNILIIDKLRAKLSSLNNIASNVSLIGLTNAYPDINPLTLYVNCAIQMVNNSNSWQIFINSSILYNRFTMINQNIQIVKTPRQSISEKPPIPIPVVAAELQTTTTPINIIK